MEKRFCGFAGFCWVSCWLQNMTTPLFAFGYGLSYTTFGYGNLPVTPQTGNLNEPVKVSFEVKNTGRRKGAKSPNYMSVSLTPAFPGRSEG